MKAILLRLVPLTAECIAVMATGFLAAMLIEHLWPLHSAAGARTTVFLIRSGLIALLVMALAVLVVHRRAHEAVVAGDPHVVRMGEATRPPGPPSGCCQGSGDP